MKSFVIFKVGETFDDLAGRIGDFEQWIIDGVGTLPFPLLVIDPRQVQALPAVADVAAAVITGSHAMVTERAPWSEALAAWLREAVPARVPVLGICYGHQLLAHALGGEVGYHPGGMELGTVPVTLTEHAAHDALFCGMPDTFPAQAVHRQSVRRLPPDAVLLAENEFEPHHAFRVGAAAWGVQFHPEFRPAAIASYIERLAGAEENRALSAQTLLAQVLPTAQAASVLERFAALATRQESANWNSELKTVAT